MLLVSVVGCKNEALKKSTSKAKIQELQKSENMQVTGNTVLISPIDCYSSVRINHEPYGLLNGDIES